MVIAHNLYTLIWFTTEEQSTSYLFLCLEHDSNTLCCSEALHKGPRCDQGCSEVWEGLLQQLHTSEVDMGSQGGNSLQLAICEVSRGEKGGREVEEDGNYSLMNEWGYGRREDRCVCM